MEFIHKQIIEKVTTNSREPGHRAIFLDTDDLIDFIQQPGTEISMSLTAAHISERILFRNPLGGVEVFTNTKRTLLHPNEPVLVDITLHRDPTAEVFTLKRA